MDSTWCSSAKRENLNHFFHFNTCFVVRSIRTNSVSCSLLTVNLTTRIRILNSRSALEHRYWIHYKTIGFLMMIWWKKSISTLQLHFVRWVCFLVFNMLWPTLWFVERICSRCAESMPNGSLRVVMTVWTCTWCSSARVGLWRSLPPVCLRISIENITRITLSKITRTQESCHLK